jgi:hypothetical protein
MKTFLLLLISFLFVFAQDSLSEEKFENLVKSFKRESIQKCGKNPCMPGIDNLGQGFNAVKGEFTNQNIIQFTYSKNKTFSDEHRKKTWGLPDEINSRHLGDGSITSHVHNSTLNYMKYMSQKVGLSAKGDWFSASVKTEQISKIVQRKSYVYAFTEQSIQVYHTIFNKILPLLKASLDFMEVINYLPEIYNKSLYRKYLIEFFGTHFVIEAKLGGSGRTESVVSTSYVRRHDEQKVEVEASVDFNWLKANAEFRRHTRSDQREYISSSTVTTSVYGGASETFKLSDWTKWALSVPFLPQVVDYKVESICEMIKENEKKKKNCHQAVLEYVAEHKRNDPIVKEVPNCMHIAEATHPPPGTIKHIGSLSKVSGSSPQVFLVKGPNSNDQCVATYSFKRSYTDVAFGQSFRIYSNNLPIYVKSSCTGDLPPSRIFYVGCKGSTPTLVGGSELVTHGTYQGGGLCVLGSTMTNSVFNNCRHYGVVHQPRIYN